MSSQEFDSIVNKNCRYESLLRKVQSFLALREPGDVFELENLISYSVLEDAEADGALSILEGEGVIESTTAAFCSNGDGLVDGEVCDICETSKLQVRDAFRLLVKVPEHKPWYLQFQKLEDLNEFQRKFITTIPHYLVALTEAPPEFLRSLRNSEVDDAGIKLKESDFRDDLKRLVSVMWQALAELPTENGRTDLIVKERSDSLDSIVGEFKVWGRNDYKQVVSQTLSYFGNQQACGFVFIINNSKSDIWQQYLANIDADSSLNTVAKKENPILIANSWRHYKTVHKLYTDHVVHLFHFIINIHPLHDRTVPAQEMVKESKRSVGLRKGKKRKQ